MIEVPNEMREQKPALADFLDVINVYLLDDAAMSLAEFANEVNLAIMQTKKEQLEITVKNQIHEIEQQIYGGAR